MKVKDYKSFLLLEKFDDNFKKELSRLGITDKDEVNRHLYYAHRGHLSDYLSKSGNQIKFGMLLAIFKDSQEAKKRTDIKIGIIKGLHRIIPIALDPFSPIFAVIGIVFGSTRAINKILVPVLQNLSSTYEGFLMQLIDTSIKVAEADIQFKDRFTRAFVVSDRLVKAIKPEVLQEFSKVLSEKMSLEDPDKEVPPHYIENELKKFLNDEFDIDPEIPLKN